MTAHQAVPMALYCFLCHRDSYVRVIHESVFIGGDTDTIAAMAGAISGAFLGNSAIPTRWRAAVREPVHSVEHIDLVAGRLHEAYLSDWVGQVGNRHPTIRP